MTEIRQTPLTGERALFQGSQLRIIDFIFSDGESPAERKPGHSDDRQQVQVEVPPLIRQKHRSHPLSRPFGAVPT